MSNTFVASSFLMARRTYGGFSARAMNRFRSFAYKTSRNHTRTCWILKCDIRKFFASINQRILKGVLTRYIPDRDVLWLLSRVIGSFSSGISRCHLDTRVGLPLGNLTSQLLVNIYMNEFDQFVKHILKAKYYVRYADDFVFLSHDKKELAPMLPQLRDFLRDRLHLELHPDKISLRTFSSGVDFLGWAHFPDHRVLRTATKRRMLQRISPETFEAVIASYLGLLKHGNARKLQERVRRVSQ